MEAQLSRALARCSAVSVAGGSSPPAKVRGRLQWRAFFAICRNKRNTSIRPRAPLGLLVPRERPEVGMETKLWLPPPGCRDASLCPHGMPGCVAGSECQATAGAARCAFFFPLSALPDNREGSTPGPKQPRLTVSLAEVAEVAATSSVGL